MRRSSAAIGLMGLLLLSLPPFARSTHGEARGSRRLEHSGCVFIVVRDSASGKPVGYASCSADSLRKGGIADSLGRCLLCGLLTGTVVLTTRALWHSPRSYTVRVNPGHTDTVRVVLRDAPILPGTARVLRVIPIVEDSLHRSKPSSASRSR